MIIFVPLLWFAAWFVIGGLIVAYGGIAPSGSGLAVFIAIFLGGAVGLPLVAWVGWRLWLVMAGGDRG